MAAVRGASRAWSAAAMAFALTAGAPSVPPGHGPLREYVRGPVGALRESMTAEARAALGSIASSEQMYFQSHGRFTAVRADDAAGFRTLGADLGAVRAHWVFAVRAASATGFTASAVGRAKSQCAGLTVSLKHARGKAPVWVAGPSR